jgi:hypothetical protein
MVNPGSAQFEIRVNSDRRKPLVVQPSFSYTTGPGRQDVRLGFELSVRPWPTVELQIEPQWEQQTQPAQYVSQTDDLDFVPTYGRYYLFSDIRRKELSIDTRLNVTFSTRLTLQMFLQPLLSSGDYFRYKHLAGAETFAFDVYEPGTAVAQPDGAVTCSGGRICRLEDQQYVDFDGDGTVDYEFEDRSFNVRSLRLNAVLRWEFRPGSTLFLVWQQSRRGDGPPGTFDVWDDLGALGSIPAANVFIAKVTYWFGL